MFARLYGKLKHCRLLSRSIGKIKDSNPGSTKRTFQWLWSQLVQLLDELREEANEESIRDVLIKPKSKATPALKREEIPPADPIPPSPATPAPPKTKPKEKAPECQGKRGKEKDGTGKGTREKPKAPPPKAKAKEGKGRESVRQGNGGKPPAPKAKGLATMGRTARSHMNLPQRPQRQRLMGPLLLQSALLRL